MNDFLFALVVLFWHCLAMVGCGTDHDEQTGERAGGNSEAAVRETQHAHTPTQSDCEMVANTICQAACRCSGAGSCNLNQASGGQELQFGLAVSACEQTVTSRLCVSSKSELEACRSALAQLTCEREGEWRAIRVHSACAISGRE